MIFIIGDPHLGLVYDDVDRTEDIKSNLLYIRDKCFEKAQTGVNEVIHLGDIFDSPNVSFGLIQWFMEYLRGFQECSPTQRFTHIILKGNHDGEPDSRKGTPLQVLESSGLAAVYFTPTIDYHNRIMYIPYCTQEEVFGIELPADLYLYRVFTHCDIEGAVRGLEQKIGRGAPVFIPKSFIDKVNFLWAGHLHEPSRDGKLEIVGSILYTDLSEKAQKSFIALENGGKYERIPIPNRPLLRWDVNWHSSYDETLLYADIETIKNKEAIITVNVVINYADAHKLDLLKLKNHLKQNFHHVRFSFDVVKERQVRVKDINPKMSDRDVFVKMLDTQGVTEKEALIKIFDEVSADGV